MDLGTFSVSLAVDDMKASRDFYAALGFEMISGDGDTWTIVSNGTQVIGLFHGMFEGNLMTFNPGWSGPGEVADDFTDVREISKIATEAGMTPIGDTSGDTPSGPASFMLTDPDGNTLLFDQHV